MTLGVKFSNAGLSRILDNQRIVPQLIATYNFANYLHFDIPEAEGTHPGWIRRTYQFNFPSAVFTRPVIIFATLPNQNYEVYSDGHDIWYQAGQPFTDPIWYVFALDYVTPSSSTHGMRIWRYPGDGAMMYDSGNYHLNLQALIPCSVDMTTDSNTAVDYPIGGVSSFSGALANGAYLIPQGEIFRSYGRRFQGYGDWRAGIVCRVRSGILDIRMLGYERNFTEDETYNPASFTNTVKGSDTGLVILAIDANMYN
jgi:hypothetical protein